MHDHIIGSGRERIFQPIASLPRPQHMACCFGLGRRANRWWPVSSADRLNVLLFSSEPNIPWGEPTGFGCLWHTLMHRFATVVAILGALQHRLDAGRPNLLQTTALNVERNLFCWSFFANKQTE